MTNWTQIKEGNKASRAQVYAVVNQELKRIEEEPVSISGYAAVIRHFSDEAMADSVRNTQEQALEHIRQIVAYGVQCLEKFGAVEVEG